MVLKRETLLGLTVGQILSIVVIFGGLMTAYASIMARITAIEVKILNVETDLNAHKIKQDIDLKDYSAELKESFNRLSDKIDEVKTMLIDKK